MLLFYDTNTHLIMTNRLFLTLCFCSLALVAFTQNSHLGFGFRAGLSYSKFDGPSDVDPNGNNLESFKMNGGFHIGVMVNYKITDLVGLRGEFMYSQRGTKYVYEGPSYFLLDRNTLTSLTLTGTRRQTLNVNNAYLDIPILAYYKLGKFELCGGFNTGLLVASTGGGSIRFAGKLGGSDLTPFDISLSHNYKSDEAGGGSPATTNLSVGGKTYMIPTFLGAYYDFDERDKDLYKTLDFGLVAGLSYFINDGLFLSARYIHGLGDMDRNEYDISLQSLNANDTYIQRSDKNTSQSFQFSVGFSF